ncbi:MAG: hypothetical protein WD941_00255 [Opitutus sp.]
MNGNAEALSCRATSCALRSAWVFLFLWPLLPAAEPGDVVRAMDLDREASVAEEQGDIPTFLSKIEEAAGLRPDFPRLLMKLAAAQLANEQAGAALATLGRIAAMGVSMPVERDDAFATLRGRPEFDAVLKKFAGNTRPQGSGEIAFALREVTGLIEGITWRESTGDFLFGDVNGRVVWIRDRNNSLRRLNVDSDELLGVFGLAVDTGQGALWAVMSAVPAMRGFSADQEGLAALAEIDLDSGEVRRTITLTAGARMPGLPLLADVVVAPDGAVYATGSATGVVWRLPAGASALEPLAEDESLMTLSAMTIVAGGSALLVADRMSGLFHVDIGSGAVRRLEEPADTTLVGIDGLVTAADGTILAIQNGTNPNRILRLQLDLGTFRISGVTILEAGHFTMAAPSLGCIGPGGDFYFVGNSGWHRFGYGAEPTEPRSLPVFRTFRDPAAR